MHKIALIRPPATYADWYRQVPLGIAYICAFLERNGFYCRIFDAYFHFWSKDKLLSRLEKYKPDVVGITAMTHEIVMASKIGSQVKKELNIPVIIGGCHITALPKETMEEFAIFDYGVYGEGEKTIVELLKYLNGDKEVELNSIKGLVFRNGKGDVCVNEPRPFLTSEELDVFPYPALYDYYDNNPIALKGKNCDYAIMTSRGCPYNCAFCMQVLGRQIRRRSAINICGEIEQAISNYSAHTINFCDEIFLSDTKEVRDLLLLMIKRGLPKRIRWGGCARVNLINQDIVALAKKAGCYLIAMGVESGDNEVLKSISKGISVEQVREAVKIIKEAGISVNAYFILGHPNETKEALQKTITLATELNTDYIAVGVMVPYPGTRIFEMALRGEGGYRLLTHDWSEYDKYCGKVLELKNLPYEELIKWQGRAYFNFYLKNFRLFDLIRFFFKKRKAFLFFLKKKFRVLKMYDTAR